MRPKSLAEIAALAARGDSFDRCLANFLDEFYAAPNADALSATPDLLAPHFGDTGRVQDAYLAATAEELARRFSLPQPAWTVGEDRPQGGEGIQPVLGRERADVRGPGRVSGGSN